MSNNIGDEGVKYISQSEYMKNITTLEMNDNKIEDEGVKYISQSEYMKNITTLDMSSQ